MGPFRDVHGRHQGAVDANRRAILIGIEGGDACDARTGDKVAMDAVFVAPASSPLRSYE
jgi:hypothetical protein